MESLDLPDVQFDRFFETNVKEKAINSYKYINTVIDSRLLINAYIRNNWKNKKFKTLRYPSDSICALIRKFLSFWD